MLNILYCAVATFYIKSKSNTKLNHMGPISVGEVLFISYEKEKLSRYILDQDVYNIFIIWYKHCYMIEYDIK